MIDVQFKAFEKKKLLCDVGQSLGGFLCLEDENNTEVFDMRQGCS